MGVKVDIFLVRKAVFERIHKFKKMGANLYNYINILYIYSFN
jgi:hypothetical protein